MRKRQINYHYSLRVTLAFGLGVFLLLLLVYLLASLLVSRLRSPSPFSHPFLSSSYQAKIPSANLNFSLGKSNSYAQVGIGRNNSSLELVMPLEKSSLKRSGSQLVYSIPEKSIEARYQLTSKGLKEEIVLIGKPKTNELKSELKLKNLIVKITPEGIPVFFDSQTDEYQFHFQKPFAKDAQGKITEDIKLKLIPVYSQSLSPLPTSLKTNPHETKVKDKVVRKLLGEAKAIEIQVEKYQLVLILNQDWLNDPQRVYPITIDPTVVHDTSSEFATGTLNRIKDSGSGSSPYLEDYHQELPTDINTVGLWHMNETSGTTVVDSSGNNNTGTATGTTIVNGKLNNARSFNGSSDYVEVTDANSLDISGSFTLEAWVKLDVFAAYKTIISKATAANEYTSNYTLWLPYQADTNKKFEATFGVGGTSEVVVQTTNAFETGKWYHLASVHDAIGDTLKIYVDGKEEGSVATSNNTPYTNNAALHIGQIYNDGRFDGLIDEVRISNIARTPEEIKADAQRRPDSVYTSDVIDLTTVTSWNSLSWTENGVQTGDGETPNSSTSLTAQWNFNETSGTSAADSSGNDNTGTVTNMTTSGQDAAAGDGWTANNKRWGAGALMFDGTDGHVTFANSLSSKTIEAWIKPTAIASINILQLSSTATVTTDASGKVTAGAGFTSPTVYVNGSSTNPYLVFGQWNHIAVTTDTTVTTSTGYLGRVGTSYFKGVVDSTRIYSRALSAVEVLSNYQSGNIEFQTRTGSTSSPPDGWEAWKPTTSESQIDSMDTPFDWATPSASIWSGVPMATSSSTFKIEGAGSLKTTIGAPKVDKDTVALWHLEETGGTGAYVKDSTANANHGTPTGTTVVDGFYGKARSFDGDDSISVGSSFITVPFSIEAWIYLNTSALTIIFAQANTLLYQNAGVLGFQRGAVPYQTIVSSAALSTNTWYRVVVTCAGTGAGQTKLYINGAQNDDGTAIPSITTGTVKIGADSASRYFNGLIDEVRISNTARTAEEIAEAYRAGRDHRISRSFSATDLSSRTKFPFYIASDRAGTFLETTVGESAYANYEPDANTVGFWHLEEQTGSGAYIKDSTSNGNNGTPTGTTFVQGKIGKAREFNGSSDYIQITDANSLDITGDMAIEAWVKTDVNNADKRIVSKWGDTTGERSYLLQLANSNGSPFFVIERNGGLGEDGAVSNIQLSTGKWYHLVGIRSGNNLYIYVNGQLTGTGTAGASTNVTSTNIRIGHEGDGSTTQYFDGTIDEVRISNTARSADEIRQAYEIGKRTHPVTIDYATTGLSSNLLTGSSDYSFDVATTSGLFKYDKIIVKENYDGTEYLAQGEVSSINTTTRTVTVSSWDSGSTFPSGGYSANGTVFKWQREWFDLTGSLGTHRDGSTRLTMRITDGSQGSNLWLDDFRSTGGYLTTPGGSTITSTAQRYFQYRAIFSTTDTAATSSALSSVTLDYLSNSAPTTPTIENNRYLDGAKVNDTTPTFDFKSTDGEADDLEYEIQADDDSNFGSLNLLAESSTSSGFLNTENGSDTHPFTQNQVISFTVQSGSALTNGTTYYYRLRAIDPAGYNTWSSWSTARSLTVDTVALKEPFLCNLSEAAGGGGPLTLTWIDQTTDEDHYYITRSLNSQVWTPWATPSANTTTYTDTSVSNNNTYQYRIRAETAAYEPDTPWCTTATINLGTGDFTIEGMEVEGMEIR